MKIRLTSRFLQIKIKEYEALKAESEDLQEELECPHNNDCRFLIMGFDLDIMGGFENLLHSLFTFVHFYCTEIENVQK